MENIPKKPKLTHQEAEYFQSYEDLSIHELMLKDKSRTTTYMKAIEDNKSEFKGKVVLDVGSGTGILSLFAARAGASKVFACEASKVALLSKTLIEKNGYSHIIEVIHGRIEDIELSEKVDIIVSEWMGFYLLHESMLDSVIYARDRFLKPGGFIWPNKAILYVCPVSMEQFWKEKFGFWSNVYGFDFSPLIPSLTNQLLLQPTITTISKDQLMSDPMIFLEIDLHTTSSELLKEIENELMFYSLKSGFVHGFCFWFDIIFEGNTEEETIILSTAPGKEETHWKQTIFLLNSPLCIPSSKHLIPCQVLMKTTEEDTRRYSVTLSIPVDQGEKEGEEEEEEIEDKHDEECSCARCRLYAALGLKRPEEENEYNEEEKNQSEGQKNEESE